MNLLDLIIILFFAYFLVLGYFRGFIKQAFDLIVVIFAFFLAFKFYQSLGEFISLLSGLEVGFGQVLGFFLIWFFVELLSYVIYIFLYDKIPEKIRDSKYNHISGVIPAFLRGMIYLWVILGLFSILPIPVNYKNLIQKSAISRPLIKSSAVIEKYIGNVFGGALNETINFLTIKPESSEKLDLGFKTTDVTVDTVAENKMLELVNEERVSKGLKPLIMDEKLRNVARNHSKDMFMKGYFAHNNLEGKTPFDRMDGAGIQYMIAGENLALAPDTDTAHRGLMESPGHRANILTSEFRKVGIGVIDGGKYGKMFSQEFTD